MEIAIRKYLHAFTSSLDSKSGGAVSKGRKGAKTSGTAVKVALMKLKMHADGDKSLPQVKQASVSHVMRSPLSSSLPSNPNMNLTWVTSEDHRCLFLLEVAVNVTFFPGLAHFPSVFSISLCPSYGLVHSVTTLYSVVCL